MDDLLLDSVTEVNFPFFSMSTKEDIIESVDLPESLTDEVDVRMFTYDSHLPSHEVNKNKLISILNDWRIPMAALNCFSFNTDLHGLLTATYGDLEVIWYGIPTHVHNNQKSSNRTIQIWQVRDPSQVRILIGCPSFLRRNLKYRFLNNVKALDHWTAVHILLLRAGMDSWQGSLLETRATRTRVVSRIYFLNSILSSS